MSRAARTREKDAPETRKAPHPRGLTLRGDEGARTPDLLIANQPLSQLSYIPNLAEYTQASANWEANFAAHDGKMPSVSDKPPTGKLSADRRFRLTRAGEIDRVFAAGRRATDAAMTLLAAPNALERSRAAVAVGRRHGSAVRRNRAKRLCREAFRLTRPELPVGWDYVILPRPGRAACLASLRESLRSLARRIERQAPAPPRTAPEETP